MLNGRVYGARNTMPVATVEEPSFVEWGYGGMGSVNNSAGSSQYARLQSDKKLSVGTTESTATADDDDGSGMAWLAKRRREREERAKEKAEQEKKEQQDHEQKVSQDASKVCQFCSAT